MIPNATSDDEYPPVLLGPVDLDNGHYVARVCTQGMQCFSVEFVFSPYFSSCDFSSPTRHYELNPTTQSKSCLCAIVRESEKQYQTCPNLTVVSDG